MMEDAEEKEGRPSGRGKHEQRGDQGQLPNQNFRARKLGKEPGTESPSIGHRRDHQGPSGPANWAAGAPSKRSHRGRARPGCPCLGDLAGGPSFFFGFPPSIVVVVFIKLEWTPLRRQVIMYPNVLWACISDAGNGLSRRGIASRYTASVCTVSHGGWLGGAGPLWPPQGGGDVFPESSKSTNAGLCDKVSDDKTSWAGSSPGGGRNPSSPLSCL